MYECYWKLAHKPFESGVDPRAYYPADTHQAALAKLRYAIENRRDAALLTGPSGTGKTMLVRLLFEQLGESYGPLVHLVYPQMGPAELLAWLAVELGAGGSEAAPTTVDTSVRRIQRRLTENATQGKHAVIAIDEAHLVEGNRAFETLRLLLNFDHGAGPDLTLLLVGQTALVPMLGRMPQLEERLGVKCLLRPLGPDEVMAYVQHRLAVAGATRTVIDLEAGDTLHRLSQGIPRQINRLCDLALLVGFAEEQHSIGAAELEAVSQELAAVTAS
ncbi:MAG: AAA family ATPase [Planctomycetia bacterium]|nr:AAA family ATPase [Planctomycetia bacterium]